MNLSDPTISVVASYEGRKTERVDVSKNPHPFPSPEHLALVLPVRATDRHDSRARMQRAADSLAHQRCYSCSHLCHCTSFRSQSTVQRDARSLLACIRTSLTKYPMKPMTTKPNPTALQIWMYSVDFHRHRSQAPKEINPSVMSCNTNRFVFLHPLASVQPMLFCFGAEVSFATIELEVCLWRKIQRV